MGVVVICFVMTLGKYTTAYVNALVGNEVGGVFVFAEGKEYASKINPHRHQMQ